MKRTCTTDGHVVVDDDPECIACGELVTTSDTVGLHINREHGALGTTRDLASIDEWGHANTTPD